MSEFFHQFVGSHPAEQPCKGDEENLTEVVEGLSTVARIGDGGKGVEVGGEAAGIVDFFGISGHLRNLNILDVVHRSVSLP